MSENLPGLEYAKRVTHTEALVHGGLAFAVTQLVPRCPDALLADTVPGWPSGPAPWSRDTSCRTNWRRTW
jgi:hypothetical protein